MKGEVFLDSSGLTFSKQALEYLDAFDNCASNKIVAQRYGVERKEGSKIEGRGLFAAGDLAAGRVIAIKPGKLIDRATVKANKDLIQHSHQQIDDDLFLAGLTPEEVDANLVGYNHSCDPNARVVIYESLPLAFLVTRKAIAAGEEITVDYASAMASDTHQIFGCQCGSPGCRRIISPRWDWLKSEVQAKYQGEFPFFIQKKIDELNSLDEESRKSRIRGFYTYITAEMVAFCQERLDEREHNLQILKEFQDEPFGVRKLVLRSLLLIEGISPAQLQALIEEQEADVKALRELKLKAVAQFVSCSPMSLGNMEADAEVAKHHEDLATALAVSWDSKQNEPDRDRVLAIS